MVSTDGIKTISIYHTVDVVDIGYKRVVKYYVNSNEIITENNYNNNQRDGARQQWYRSGQQITGKKKQQQLKFERYYINGKKYGP